MTHRRELVLSATTSLVVLSLLLIELPPIVRPEMSSRGPRTEDLFINYYGNVEDAYAALKAGEVDVVAWRLTDELLDDAVSDPNVELIELGDNWFNVLDINNNYTIHSYPGIRSPMSYREMRRAVARCTDKNYIVNLNWGNGLSAERVDAIVPAPQKKWSSESSWYPNYPYEYDPARASAELDSAGWVQGTTPNPYYDSQFPGSAQYLRTYPPGHAKAGQDLDQVEFYIDNDRPTRLLTGRHVAENLQRIGIPIHTHEGSHSTNRPMVRIMKDYHLAAYAAIATSSLAPTHLYTFYHSVWWIDGVSSNNYVTGYNASGLPNYPYYDELVEQFWHALTPEEAVIASRLATRYWTEECINIPLCSLTQYWACSSRILGAVNERMEGLDYPFFFMNSFSALGSIMPIKYATTTPDAMNVIKSSSRSLNLMNLNSRPDTNPYDRSRFQASVVTDWEASFWLDGSVNKTKVSQWFRNDAYFVEPLTGNRKSNLNASDYFFTAWMVYHTGARYVWMDREELHHIDILDGYQVDVFLDHADTPWLRAVGFGGPLIPMDVWMEQPELSNTAVETFVEGVNLTTPGSAGLAGKPVWIESVAADGQQLTMFSDYNIVKGKLEIFSNLTEGSEVVVDYWLAGDPTGYTPADLPWQTVFEGAGMYYAVDFTPGAGGSLVLKRNPYYWMETPPLGDVDFEWKWQEGPKPRSGCFEIDIYDIVIAASAYGSSGVGEPDHNWVPAADVARPGGVVNIYDIITIAGNYGKQWGHTP